MDGNLLDLVFEFKPYWSMLNKKVEKDDKYFSNAFVKETKEGSKSGK